MKIGCLAWGSLVWDPRTLPCASAFFEDGPTLPIDFSRVSLDGRVTLVIDRAAPRLTTLWVELSVSTLSEAVEALGVREKIVPARRDEWVGRCRRGEAVGADSAFEGLEAWLSDKALDAVVWTALPCRSPNGAFERPSLDALVEHLAALEGDARARARGVHPAYTELRRDGPPRTIRSRIRLVPRPAVEAGERSAGTGESMSGWEFMTPQLPVRDVRETQAYYRDVLGCKIAWIYQEEYGAVYNGRTEIYFSLTTEPITPSWNFVRVSDADAGARGAARPGREGRRGDRVASLGHARVHDRGPEWSSLSHRTQRGVLSSRITTARHEALDDRRWDRENRSLFESDLC